MKKLTDQVQTADWKTEKHVPVIDAPDKVKADEVFRATVTLGKEVAHPNKTEHHIRPSVWCTSSTRASARLRQTGLPVARSRAG